MTASVSAELCGELRVELDGRRVESEAGGRQGRLLLAFLLVNRRRPVGREELLELLWPGKRPPDPDAALRTQLSKLRRALGPDVLEGRGTLRLRLPANAVVDLEVAEAALGEAERSLTAADWAAARASAARAVAIAERGFCVGLEGDWVDARRDALGELRLRALECLAEAALELGAGELTEAVDAARKVVADAPLRESGQRLLMLGLARRGSVPEALQVYDGLRHLLREQLGTTPSPSLIALHDRLVRGAPAGDRAGGDWVVVNPGSPRESVVQLEEVLLVGRDPARVEPSRRLVLDDPAISREHLELRRDPERGVVLVDMSTNGTRVNGNSVEPGEPVALRDGDVIELGDERLHYRAPPADSDADRAKTTLRR